MQRKMNLGRVGRRVGAASMALAAIALAGCGTATTTTTATTAGHVDRAASKTPAATTSTGGDTINADLNEYKIATSAQTIPAGEVKFNATNTGKQPHELIVIRTDKPASALGNGARVSEHGSIGEISDLKSGKSDSARFNLKPGHYALICNIPGHYKAGMYTDLTVK